MIEKGKDLPDCGRVFLTKKKHPTTETGRVARSGRQSCPLDVSYFYVQQLIDALPPSWGF